jgi:hypothetical protein
MQLNEFNCKILQKAPDFEILTGQLVINGIAIPTRMGCAGM